ncbi:hypothetical protein LMG6871_02865 [Ralstonia edaphis]|uniref:hypothetical protein n=1 Tax=Ralstonia edaphi TaxID=3058599 RepID=UPI0028F62510|nr:hypothetical protein [Ralstonia sp. LMG 6871]CAJ0719440.1 hypothetical protein LMG6871_02865 [Ralstonia sp. LMG 6871]
MKNLILAAALVAPVVANAQSFEAAVGMSTYSAQANGTWYQEGMPHSLKLRSPAFALGFTGPIYQRERWGVDWHVNYVYLGQVTSDCFCTAYDANYDFVRHQKINAAIPDQHFHGTGHAQGVALTVEPYVMYRGWRFAIEAGLFPYRPTFDETVTNADGSEVLAQYPTPHAIQLGKTFGVSVGRGNFRVSLKRYILPTRYDDQHSPAVWRDATMVEIRYVF